jgi:SAM-dependent methyltransferase
MADGRKLAERSFDELMDEAMRAPFEGWNFSFLRGRTEYEPLPWDYARVVGDLVGDRPLLDLGTGGGEVLSRLPARPGRTVATEAWAPNVPVAARRLGRLGIPVVQYQAAPGNLAQGPGPGGPRERLPFRDEAFGLVISRHEAFLASEVARVLGPGGWFVTQQVDLHWADDFRAALDLPADVGGADSGGADSGEASSGGADSGGTDSVGASSWLPVARRQVAAAGLVVTRARAVTVRCSFTDVGALAYYLIRAVPWVVPEAGRPESRPAFRRLHERLRDAPLRARNPHFLLVARKPVAGRE